MSILIGLFGRPVTGCLYFMCCRFMSLACARGKSIKKQNKNRSLLRLSVQYFASSQAPLPVHSLASHRPVRATAASCESLRRMRAHARLMCVAHDGMLAVHFTLSSTTLDSSVRRQQRLCFRRLLAGCVVKRSIHLVRRRRRRRHHVHVTCSSSHRRQRVCAAVTSC